MKDDATLLQAAATESAIAQQPSLVLQALKRNACHLQGEPSSLLLTGHSLGGGIALCLLVKLIDVGFQRLAGALTFGAPLVLRSSVDNSACAQILQNYFPPDCRVHNFVNGCDLVPRALGQSLEVTMQLQETMGALPKGVSGILLGNNGAPAAHRFVPFGSFHFMMDGRYLQSADALAQPSLLQDGLQACQNNLMIIQLHGEKQTTPAPLLVTIGTGIVAESEGGNSHPAPREVSAVHMGETTALAWQQRELSGLMLAGIATVPFGIVGASAASMQLHGASTKAHGGGAMEANLGLAMSALLSNVVACWTLWQIVSDGQRPDETSLSATLQRFVDESRECHTHLQDSVHEAASVVADFNKFIHRGPPVTEQDLDSALPRTISSRPQELAVALGTVNDAYNDLLKAVKRQDSEGEMRSFAKDLMKAARSLRATVEAELKCCDDCRTINRLKEAGLPGLQHLMLKLKLRLHTLVVTAAVQQDFAESILERALQTSARQAARATILAPVANVIEAASIIELANKGISSCLGSFKALLVALQAPIPVICLDSASSGAAALALNSHELAWDDGLTPLRTALQAMMQETPPSSAHKPASQVRAKVSNVAVLMDELLCNLGMEASAASRAWVRQCNGAADIQDVHIQAVQAAVNSDFRQSIRELLLLQFGLVQHKTAGKAVSFETQGNDRDGAASYPWQVSKGLATALAADVIGSVRALEVAANSTWHSLLVPAGVPQKLIEKVNEPLDAQSFRAVARGISHLTDSLGPLLHIIRGLLYYAELEKAGAAMRHKVLSAGGFEKLAVSLNVATDPKASKYACEALSLLTIGEVREESLSSIPLHLRRSVLEKAIQLIKLHAPDPDQHMLAGEAASVLTNLSGHDENLDRLTLKSKVAKDLHLLLQQTLEVQPAMCAALALCELMDIEPGNDATVAHFVWHNTGVLCFMKLFDFPEPAAYKVGIIGLCALDKRFGGAAQQMMDAGITQHLSNMLKHRSSALDAARGCPAKITPELSLSSVRGPDTQVKVEAPSAIASAPAAGSCGRNYEPVCGADQQTYGNACVAKEANVVIAAQGKCPPYTGSKGDCTCNNQPMNPVCSQGTTWENACEADCSFKFGQVDNVCQYIPGQYYDTIPGGAVNGGVAAASQNSAFPGSGSSPQPYGAALGTALLYYRASQSGTLDEQRLAWRSDSCQDCKGPGGEDVSGGYYEAGGSFLKLGLPSAYVVTNLAWAMQAYPSGFEKANLQQESETLLKWGADYLVSAWNPTTQSFVAVVGDNTTDFNYYGPVEEYQYFNPSPRPTWYASTQNPASEVAGEAAAGLAAAYIALGRTDNSYLQAAESLYKWGVQTSQSYAQSGGRGSTIQEFLYPSMGFEDELAWAAAWLFAATNNTSYLDDAQKYYGSCCNKGGYTFEVGEKTPALHVLLAQLDPSDNGQYKSNAQTFFQQYLTQQIPHTPRGAAYPYHWGALRPAMSTSFLAQLYSTQIKDTDPSTAAKLFNYAEYQANYVLGANGYTWLTGFGQNYADFLWHKSSYNAYIDWPLRGQSVWMGKDRGPWTVDGPAGDIIVQASKLDMEGSFSPQRFIAYGALVGAPLFDDGRVYGRKDYTYMEPTLEGQGGKHALGIPYCLPEWLAKEA
ncbi:hypothetical protein WJX73_008956 [Symbiochloris irregularis]|uniref:cellulase n=1 Tax=Symbiochloris irregularis TaxID=706552 RepID=A0AAW1NK94_9CHLO